MAVYNDGWSTLLEPRVSQAIREIADGDGRSVSVLAKRKSLYKFGELLDTPTTLATLSTLGDETYVDDNLIDTVSSSSASDSGTLYLEGHRFINSGSDLEFRTQLVEVNGQSKVTLSEPWGRVNRARWLETDVLQGDVRVYQDSAITSGVPDDLTLAHIEILAGRSRSFKAATTISYQDYYIITQIFAEVIQKQAGFAKIELESRVLGQAFETRFIGSASANSAPPVELNPCIWLGPNTDVRLRAAAGTAGLDVAGYINGLLALDVGSAE